MQIIEELKPLLLPILQSIATDESGEVIKSLQPGEDDYVKVFSEELIEAAKLQYTDWTKQYRQAISFDEGTRIDAHMAPAGMLIEENALSYHFPNGYQSIAEKLNPQRVWVCWKIYQQGESAGNSMNGLVWVDDHWAWFPKPYKLLK